jgi:F420H(2)-dependent quinone reductase
LRNVRFVGTAGFEPATPRPPAACSTKLSHVPSRHARTNLSVTARRIGNDPAERRDGSTRSYGYAAISKLAPGMRHGLHLVLTVVMPVEGQYEPSTAAWVRDQVELYEGSGGTRGTTLRDTGLPVVVVTNRGAKSGKVHKTPVMRVEHDGRYAMVASKGGAPKHPLWYYNVRANPLVELQDGPDKRDMIAREVSGDERAEWWQRAVAAYPPYADYQQRTTRQIPVFVLEPAAGT